ncbi:MAG: exodeoxyribonuclease V subunit gamma [Azoarcus sp.]|jgi:exodeoxyribonuclease V gamma subunit|nr:exodeoxyribonuclease V subunit gamma [Azoarcus sp.]
MFSVVFSNRCENLLDALLARLGAERRDPFARAQVVTPNSALRRRIELAMADRAGVCAGIDFDYLVRWLWRQIGRIVEVPEVSPYTPPALLWLCFAALGDPWTRRHERLARYLDDADARKRFELSERLAHLFDRYLGERPTWLERWSAGETALTGAEPDNRADEAWQAELWRRIHHGQRSPSLPFMRFLRRAAQMDAADLAAAGLPASLHVFALPSLPPIYLEVLRALARAMDIHLYVLNPCREYWFDIVDMRRLSWLALRQRDLFLDAGNRLLAAWGKQTQAHIESLYEGEHPMLEEACFVPHPARHLLARLQNAILDLQELEAGAIRLDDDDRSIEVHLCHSRTRELEVLHDRLLGIFKGPKPPRPDEIVVLTPDLAACAPLIEAVFGAAPAGRRIPWRITGLGIAGENPVAQALDGLLALAAGRAGASQVFDLLRQPLVAAHFGLDEAGLEQIRTWMDGASIRWGLDAGQARAIGASGAHTVEQGLDRLFLSWAAGDAAGRATFAGRIGAARAPQGSAGLALGAFWLYTRNLGRLRAELLQTHDAEGWRAVLLDALASLVGEAGGHAEELRAVRDAINALADDIAAGLGATPAPIPLEVIHPALAARLDESARGGVPGGAVTFSALSSLRGLPYRVVCVIGLDYGAFPGRGRADEFDLIAARPQKGDRQRQADERNLFLDVVLAARDALHLSCIGHSARDNTEVPPSVLVDELLDVLAAACATDPRQAASLAAARARLTVRHPLQSFSPACFVARKKDKRIENFRVEYADALNHRQRRERARATGRPMAPEPPDGDGPFFVAPLPPPPEDWRRVELAQLKRFFNNPSRFLLRERLGLDLPATSETLADVEPFIPAWQARGALAGRLLPVLLAAEGGDGTGEKTAAGEISDDDDEILALARAGGEYPTGALGEVTLRRELACLRAFAGRINAARTPPCLPAHTSRLDFALDGETWTLQAAFGAPNADGLLLYRYDEARPRDYLAAWLDHLTLCAAPPPGSACRTRVLSRDDDFVLRPLPPAEARAQLEKLLALYREGLSQPLRFFPKAAWEYTRHADPARGRAAAEQKWAGGDYPEKDDAAHRLALRGADDVLDERFRDNATAVFGALRQSIERSTPTTMPRTADASEA